MDDTIDQAIAILRRGGLVAFPTETVYGLGADASNRLAVERIFTVKGRPADHPLIVHLASAAQLSDWARAIPDTARELARVFWPGPLTLILARAAGVLDAVTGGQDTVGVRVPSHPLAQQLLQRFAGGIAAPSANRFGRLSPTTAAHVRQELGDAVDLVLDGGPCMVGIESTILDLSSGHPVLLRPGHIRRAAIEAVAGPLSTPAPNHPTRASGTLAAHYAPSRPLRLVPATDLVSQCGRYGAAAAILARRPPPTGIEYRAWRVAAVEAVDYARELYAALRDLDHAGGEVILVETPPDTPEWAAVQDRLRRSATGSEQHHTATDETGDLDDP